MIEATHLTKRYGATVAVDGLSFRVRPGRVTGFLGPNGAGKSTTLRMILGLTAPSGGTVTVDGVPFADRPRGLRHVGALLDAQDVHGGRSAAAHLSALARSNHIPRGRVADVLEEVGLGKAAGRRIGGFSLGMKQRLGIAAALLGEPRVLLFDEPLNGLDLEGVLWVRGLFRRLAAEGRTVLVSSHMMSEIEHTAEQVLVIGRGRLIADEHLASLSGAAHGVAVVSVRTADVAALTALLAEEGATVRQASESEEAVEVSGLSARRIGELAGRHGLTLYELATRSSSLESAFLRLTADSVEYPAGPPARTGSGHRTGGTR
ncbi:ABC transporter ATP-binding protein [Streptomyces sp. NPDC087270]|uniref:ABC transporter ATP-binding protein n=1 Tax=Streptomyces sp. NPDC087270 TaxID=3365774 RepID=UPI00382F96DE